VATRAARSGGVSQCIRAVVAGLAAVPARIGARRPAAEILQAETA